MSQLLINNEDNSISSDLFEEPKINNENKFFLVLHTILLFSLLWIKFVY